MKYCNENQSLSYKKALEKVEKGKLSRFQGCAFIKPTEPKGPTGPTGPQGLQGPQGEQGPQGIQGIKGDMGITGIQGIPGPLGLQGIEGIQGIPGVQGLQGIDGLNGRNGKNATILGSYPSIQDLNNAHPNGVLEAAYLIGTDLYIWEDVDKAWENVGNIEGPQGMEGPQGLIGPTGLVGNQGLEGLKGDIGPTGIKGITGPTGNTVTTYSQAFLDAYSAKDINLASGILEFPNITIQRESLIVFQNGNKDIALSGDHIYLIQLYLDCYTVTPETLQGSYILDNVEYSKFLSKNTGTYNSISNTIIVNTEGGNPKILQIRLDTANAIKANYSINILSIS